MLLHLPKELISLIFSRLDGRSLVLCQLLSRQCSEVILSNLQLTYRINLFSANLTDNPNHHAPLIERSESLKSFIRARDEGNWSDPVILDSLFEVAHSDTFRSLRAFSGVLAFSADGHFCCIDASEVASGGRVRRWEFVAKFPDAAFIFPYPPQNLLLVKERQPGQLIFRPLSLETGQDHPEALRRSLPPIPCPAETIYNDYYVCDEYLRV
ncbi:hypothetical protein BDN72DRAFT_897315 [Pluteus cervinus]|uniref:Uncharacterized protein n=1 Tax=Pluteus cervinus TaxID=181527 RepID=A0ACD3AVQ8_9AGAR|nr:hypothetical protein BDN72DRAFT_897315 [Pluteus cervinus]